MGESWLEKGSTDSDEVARYYDEWAATYNQSLEEWEYTAPEHAAGMLKKYSEHRGPVLDAGCGTGLTGAALRRAGFQPLVGTDISPASVEQARAASLYDEVTVVDLQQLPLPFGDDQFSAVNCVGVLTYIDKREELLREFARVTRPGGLLAFTHRSDLAREQNFQHLLDTLETGGLFKKIEVSEPSPYLPGNEEFADAILVIYYLYSVI